MEKQEGVRSSSFSAIITGTGFEVPKHVMTNAELEKLVNTSDEWITERTGVKERPRAGAVAADRRPAALRLRLRGGLSPAPPCILYTVFCLLGALPRHHDFPADPLRAIVQRVEVHAIA